MLRSLFSIYFSIAIFINSVVFTVLMGLGLIVVNWTSKKKSYLHFIAGSWARNCVRLIFSPPRIIGLENVDFSKNYIVVANHASNFDIFMLLGYIDLKTIFISKQANFRIPVIGIAMRMMGCIPIKRDNSRAALTSLNAGAAAYRNGDSIIIFPEGTRSPNGLPQPFKQGFLHVVKQQPTWILPVTLSGTYKIQPKKSWHIHPSLIEMVIEKPILVTPKEIESHNGRLSVIKNLEQTIGSHFKEVV